jgi:protein-S-isoprenylcysteine O-methyltransferase Ste14
MIPLIERWIATLWLAFWILWIVAGIASKRSVQRQTGSSRLLQAGLALIGIMLIFNFNHWFVTGWLTTRIVPIEPPYVLGGAVLTVAGLLFCIWARAILGSNWSATVTIKQNHTLVYSGPYRIVRHPIYTGILTALLGTAFVYGFTRCFVGVLVAAFALWLKLQIEEQFMLQQFGQQYAEYRQHTRALIPFVL